MQSVEALAYLACLFDDEELRQFKDLTAVFTSPATLRTLVASCVPFIPIVHSEDAERELAVAHHRLHCIVFRPRNAVDTKADIALDLLSFDAFEKAHGISRQIAGGGAHLLGTSGTVTTVAGVHLGLPCYTRSKVDGCWLSDAEVRTVISKLLTLSYEGRAAQPCVGPERADLVLAGCAILEAMMRLWPCKRLRVADRGLREGILANLIAEDAHANGHLRGR